MTNRFERWRSGENAALWYEAGLMKQAKKVTAQRKHLPPERKHFVFKDNLLVRQKFYLLIELKKLHPEENEIFEPLEDYSCEIISSMRTSSFCSSSFFRNSQQLGRPKCSQSIFSIQLFNQFFNF